MLGLAAAMFISGAQAYRSGDARLIVRRSADFGGYVTLQVWIDDVEAADIRRGRRYDRIVPAGRHIVTVTSVPNTRNYPPTSWPVMLQPGETYTFTAGWDPDRGVVLLR